MKSNNIVYIVEKQKKGKKTEYIAEFKTLQDAMRYLEEYLENNKPTENERVVIGMYYKKEKRGKNE